MCQNKLSAIANVLGLYKSYPIGLILLILDICMDFLLVLGPDRSVSKESAWEPS